MEKRKKTVILVVTVVLVVVLMARCMPLSAGLSSGRVVYKNTYTGVSFEDTLSEDELKAVIDVINGKTRHSMLLVIPSCGWDWDIAFIINGTRYMLALDTCGTVFIGGVIPNAAFTYIDVTNEEQDVLEAIFTSRGGTFPCI